MLFKILILKFFGYVNVEVEGFFIEKFINICFAKGIFLWRIERKNSTTITARISISDFKILPTIARKTKCKVRLKEKRGLPFLMNKYKKRKIFAITILVIAFLIFGLTRFVWNIELVCDGDINNQEILELLAEDGIKEGVLIYKIDTEKAINEIRLKRSDISWIGIKISGTNVIVNIVKATEKPEIIDDYTACNIVSDKEAIITKITATKGTARVKAGDTVKPGDLLVEGIMEGKYTGNRYVHAEAEILAKVWYTKEETADLIQEYNVDTGNEKNKYSLKINNFKINFNKGVPNFENYDTIESCKKLKLFSNYYIPIEIVKTTYKETKLEYKEYTIEELSNELQIKLKQELLEENGISEEDVIEIIPTVTQTQTSITVKLTCSTEEEIGTLEQLVY